MFIIRNIIAIMNIIIIIITVDGELHEKLFQILQGMEKFDRNSWKQGAWAHHTRLRKILVWIFINKSISVSRGECFVEQLSWRDKNAAYISGCFKWVFDVRFSKNSQELSPKRHISLLLRASINPQRWKQLMCASPRVRSVQFSSDSSRLEECAE